MSNKDLKREAYIKDVETALNSILNLAKKDKSYYFEEDLKNYYKYCIKNQGVLSKEEFLDILNNIKQKFE